MVILFILASIFLFLFFERNKNENTWKNKYMEQDTSQKTLAKIKECSNGGTVYQTTDSSLRGNIGMEQRCLTR